MHLLAFSHALRDGQSQEIFLALLHMECGQIQGLLEEKGTKKMSETELSFFFTSQDNATSFFSPFILTVWFHVHIDSRSS